jgi:hypothetical protein
MTKGTGINLSSTVFRLRRRGWVRFPCASAILVREGPGAPRKPPGRATAALALSYGSGPDQQ